jgi:hypothetical protein
MGKGKGGATKRPRSGYILFTMAEREAVKTAEPGINTKEIMKRLAEKWKALSDAEKKVYNDKAAKEKEASHKPASSKKAGKKDTKSGKKKEPVKEEESGSDE